LVCEKSSVTFRLGILDQLHLVVVLEATPDDLGLFDELGDVLRHQANELFQAYGADWTSARD